MPGPGANPGPFGFIYFLFTLKECLRPLNYCSPKSVVFTDKILINYHVNTIFHAIETEPSWSNSPFRSRCSGCNRVLVLANRNRWDGASWHRQTQRTVQPPQASGERGRRRRRRRGRRRRARRQSHSGHEKKSLVAAYSFISRQISCSTTAKITILSLNPNLTVISIRFKNKDELLFFSFLVNIILRHCEFKYIS